MNGVRKHNRFPIKLPVRITVPSEPAVQCEAQLLDMSVEGMGLRTRREFALGTQINVSWDRFCFSGAVRNCKKQWKGYHSPHDNYRIGVRMPVALDERQLDDIVSGAWRKSLSPAVSAAFEQA
jgi:hypothetical protein